VLDFDNQKFEKYDLVVLDEARSIIGLQHQINITVTHCNVSAALRRYSLMIYEE
jgi:hypothetical protein